ncbi:MDR family MFS transporter [Georgenia sp. 10Sc9-8]|uniref:MDR family MFS transporter n=1 Tax=Georgenia halotolerans TaxID=3028317 RepID=A0ABT5TVR0_9MICO|nr:MDR family MFS transporter [Georgenia halotolerans]
MSNRRNATSGTLGSRRTAEQQAQHREIMPIFVGLLLVLFVAMMSNTIVGTTLPVIIGDLGGTQMQYTWIATAMLLASTISAPIIGKLADLLDKKKLLMWAIVVFTAGSLLSGAVADTGQLIAARVVQGLGMGGLMSMVQIVIASIIPPRERGRYSGYMGAAMAVATVSGPLIGGLIVDVPWLGWRWTFWIGVPFALAAMAVLHRLLRIPPAPRRAVHIDYWGATLITLSVTSLLLWLSFAGTQFPWGSWQTAVMVGGGVLAALAFVLVEVRVREPLVPMWLLAQRTTALAVVSSFAVGIAMMSMPIFLGQYFQLGRGYSPTESGLMLAPMMLGVFVASTVAGRLVSARGTWKRYVVGGMILLTGGAALMVTTDADTPVWLVGTFMLLFGLGQGASMQNIVLAVQNTVGLANMGAATSVVTFFRTLGGAIGVQVLGAVFANHVSGLIARRAVDAGLTNGVDDVSTSSVDFDVLPAALEEIVRGAYADGMSVVFLGQAVFALVGTLAVLGMRGSTLRDTVDLAKQEEVRTVLEEGASEQEALTVATEVAQRDAAERAQEAGEAADRPAPGEPEVGGDGDNAREHART